MYFGGKWLYFVRPFFLFLPLQYIDFLMYICNPIEKIMKEQKIKRKQMKKIRFSVIFCVGMVALFFSACTTNPDWVVEHFVKHWFKGELEEAKPYLSPDSRKYADQLKNAKTPKEFDKMSEIKVDFKVLNVTKQNDSIHVYHCEVTLDSTVQEMDINLKRLKHRWFIDITN